jgi:putative FmdB family regulatory protein
MRDEQGSFAFLYYFYTLFHKRFYNVFALPNKHILLEDLPMPLYGFECEDCQEEFEELVLSFSKSDEVACPDCGSHNVARQLSLVAAIKTGSSAGFNMDNSACAPSG